MTSRCALASATSTSGLSTTGADSSSCGSASTVSSFGTRRSVPSTPAPSGPVACIAVKPAGKPDAGNRHVRGKGNGVLATGPKLPRPSSTLP
jgi:hypothetical protein